MKSQTIVKAKRKISAAMLETFISLADDKVINIIGLIKIWLAKEFMSIKWFVKIFNLLNLLK